MSSRAARIASAVFAAILMGAPVTAILHVTANAADACRTEPGDQAPEGKHWYYRIEHPSNRQCWNLRDIGERPAQAGLTQRSEKAVEPKAETPEVQRSLADAHAELPWPQTRVEQDATSTPQRSQTVPSDAANTASAQRPNVLEGTTRGSLMGSRWPDPGVNSAASPQPSTSNTLADAQPDPATTPAQAAAPATLAVADAVPAKPTGSLPTLLMVVAGALALAGLIASAIFRLGSPRRPAPNPHRGRRRVVWETADGARQSPSRGSPRQAPLWVDPDQIERRPDFSPSFQEASDPNERLGRISEFLERMSKQPSH
jgi:hypothetical protein